MKVLFIGDVYGKPGREILKKHLPNIKSKYKPNLIIVNGENSAHGKGITEKIYNEFMKENIDFITLGNHAFSNYDVFKFIDKEDVNIIRPANFRNVAGKGYKIINYNNKKVLIINLVGKTFMNANVLSPFLVADEILKKEKYDYSIIDFHAEATSEKESLARYLDGRVDLIVGSHTHIPTADERLLKKGSLYITDVGMTGPYEGIIGAKKNVIIERFLSGVFIDPAGVEEKGDTWLNGVICNLTKKTIKRINIVDKEVFK